MAVEPKDFLGYKQVQPFKFKQRVVGGKLVDIDPTTDQPFKKGAKAKYLQKRRSEVGGIGEANRQRLKGHVSKLLHSSPTISTLLKINKQRGEEKRAILENRAPWDLSEVPVSNFDPSILKAEGLEDKEYLNNAEADRLFRRQELVSRIQQAKSNTANQREQLRVKEEFEKKTEGIGEDPTLGGLVGSGELLMSGGQIVRQGTIPEPITITNKEKTENNNKIVKEELKIAEKQSAFTPRSDVFTIDPATGEAVGVLTRNQRKNFEARADVQAALKATPKNELRIYKNRTGAG